MLCHGSLQSFRYSESFLIQIVEHMIDLQFFYYCHGFLFVNGYFLALFYDFYTVRSISAVEASKVLLQKRKRDLHHNYKN